MLDLPVVGVLLMTELCCRTAKLHIMPIFTPNDFMLEAHADKGEEEWQIYSWCIRDAIAKAGNFNKVDFYKYDERTAYYDFMNGRLDVLNVQGKSFSYEDPP